MVLRRRAGARLPSPPCPNHTATRCPTWNRRPDSTSGRFAITSPRVLLPPAHGRGPSATYDLGHLLRLRMIQLLKDAERLPLEDIKTRLADLTDRDIAAMLEVQTRPVEDRWRRLQLHPDVELHIRDAPANSAIPTSTAPSTR